MLRRAKADDPSDVRILVVDDDADACELLARLVESQGWQADRLHSHQDAILQLSRPDHRVDGLIADFSSGGTASNLKLLESVRHGDAHRRHLPVMLLTESPQNRSFAFQSGADAFLVRPFHANEMLEELHAMLSRTDEEREAHRREQLAAG